MTQAVWTPPTISSITRVREAIECCFEPFGGDYQQGTLAGATENGLYLRLPGQWDDGTWDDATSGASFYYNVHRWYAPGVGRYTRPDPAGIGLEDATNLYLYGLANPLFYFDPDGRVPLPYGNPLRPFRCALNVGRQMQNAFPPNTNDKFKHCVVSCEIQNQCGFVGATAAGVGKEIQDTFGPGNAELLDLVADFEGILCGIDLGKGRGGPACSDCNRCCASGRARTASTVPFLVF